MSKQNPNQDYYKTGGRGQSEGPDRLSVDVTAEKRELARVQPGKDSSHPAVRRAKKK